MKKLLVLVLAMSSTAAVVPTLIHARTPQAADASKPTLMTIKGTVKADGDKIMFVNDADGKSWDVMNPETLKPHVGHHVELSAHVYSDKAQIHVMSVKMLKMDAK
jgi:hypothetical protein